MIEAAHGDLLTADVDALVNPVNCVGSMGKGLALQFKRAYAANNSIYTAACKLGQVEPGRMLVYEVPNATVRRFIINYPTKRHWRDNSRLGDIRAGLSSLVGEVRTRGIRSIAIPPLGCGLGGLDWNVVRPMIVDAFAELPAVRVLVFEPQ